MGASQVSITRQPNAGRAISLAALLLTLLICGLLGWRAVQSAQFSATIFAYPFQLDESESMIAAETLLLDRGENIYNFPAPQRFVAAPYPPVYYLLNLPIIHFSGYSLKVGRVITIIFTLAAAALIFALVQLATHRRLAALAAALAFLANALTAFWGAIVKPDVPAMTFALAGMYLIAKGLGQSSARQRMRFSGETEEGRAAESLSPRERFGEGEASPASTLGESTASQRIRFSGETDKTDTNNSINNSNLKPQTSNLIYAAAVCFALAMLTKQTSVAAAGAGLLVLLLADWRRGRQVVGLYVGIVAAVSLLLNWQTAGGYYWHIITVHRLPWNFDRLLGYVALVWAVNWPLILLGGLGLLLALIAGVRAYLPRGSATPLPVGGAGGGSESNSNSNLKPQTSNLMLGIYGLAALVQSSGVGTLGGNHNHFLDALSALCLGFGLLLGGLLDWADEAQAATARRAVGLGGLAAAGMAVWLLIGLDYDPHDHLAYQLRPPSATQLEGMSNIAQFATNNGGLLYSDNVSLVLSAKQLPVSTDPYTQTHAANPAIHPQARERWDESKLVADIRAKRFGLIILNLSEPCGDNNGTLSPALAAAVCDSYKLIQRNVEFVYGPK